MIHVAITGNIGSGKTTVSKIFQTLGIPVYAADQEAKKFLAHPNIIQSLTEQHGDAILDQHNIIDRKKLAAIVFNDASALAHLNNIIHPLVKNDFQQWLTLHTQQTYILHEAAILIESGFYRMFDKIIMVIAPEELRIKRLIQRDGTSRKDIQQRINNQMSQEDKLPYTDFVIINDGNRLVIPQVLEIHHSIIHQ